MPPAVIGLGAGGHAAVVLEAIRAAGTFEVIGLLDADPSRHGADVLGVPVLGGDDMVPRLRDRGVAFFFVGVGSVGSTAVRRAVFERALAHGLRPITVVHPRAFISPSAVLGDGATVLAGAIVHTRARLGRNVLINTGVIVEHDCDLGDHVHIAPGACLSGTVKVGAGAHIGTGATLRQGLIIGAEAVVGAGAVVIDDVPPGQIVVGVPARALADRSHSNSKSRGETG